MTPQTDQRSRPGIFLPGLFFLAAARAHLLLPAWLAALTGAAIQTGSNFYAMAPASGRYLGTTPLAGLAAWSLILLAANLINLLDDQQTDLINAKNQAWKLVLKPRQLVTGALCLVLGGLTLAFLTLPQMVLPLLVSIGLGLAYSLKPLRLCGRPGWDIAVHLTGYAVTAPWVGAILVAVPQPGQPWWDCPAGPPALSVLFLTPVVSLTFLLTALLDLEGDRTAGKRTSAVFLAGRMNSLVRLSRRTRSRRIIILLVFGGVILAGLPGILAWPRLALILVPFLVASYGLQLLVSRVRASRPAIDGPISGSAP